MTSENVAAIPEIASGVERPVWSVLIPTYNSGDFLRQTLQSVLAQDQGPSRMEIIVVDDHSLKDDSAAIVAEVGGTRVRFIRQTENVGKVRNYETGLAVSKGMLIHQLHGDDRVRPGFYQAMQDAFNAFPLAGAFFCETNYIDEQGRVTGRSGSERESVGLIEDWLEKIVVSQRVQTPSMVLRRSVYEQCGGFDRRLDAFEDWEMWIRIAGFFPVGFVPQPLADYRISAANNTARSLIDGSRVAVLRRMLSIVDDYLPVEVVARHRRNRNRAMAEYLLQFVPGMLKGRQYRAAARFCRDALAFSPEPHTLRRMLNYTIHSEPAASA